MKTNGVDMGPIPHDFGTTMLFQKSHISEQGSLTIPNGTQRLSAVGLWNDHLRITKAVFQRFMA